MKKLWRKFLERIKNCYNMLEFVKNKETETEARLRRKL